jgi:uncharacterized membrane protein
MNPDPQPVEQPAVQPVACLRDAWRLIKGDYWRFFAISFAGLVLAIFGTPLAMGPAFCGIYYCLLRRERGLNVSFRMLFRGFDYTKSSLGVTSLVYVPFGALAISLGGGALYMLALVLCFAGALGGLNLEGLGRLGQELWPGGVFYVLGMGTAMALFEAARVFFFFAYPLIVDGDITTSEAIVLSMRTVRANFFRVLAVLTLSDLLGVLGGLAFGFGFIFVWPIMMAMTIVALRQVFPRDTRPNAAGHGEKRSASSVETGIQATANVTTAPVGKGDGKLKPRSDQI